MLFFFGTRARGRVDVASGGYVETDFICVQGLPFVPTGTFFVNTEQGARQPLGGSTSSLVAGYLRGWTAIPFGFLLFLAVYFASGADSPAQMFALAAAPLALAAVFGTLLFLGMRIGRLSEAELLAREAYGRACGASVDVALLTEADQRSLRVALLAGMESETRASMSETYRELRSPEDAYVEVATGLEPQSLDYLCGALTLTRLDSLRGTPAQRAALQRAHAEILTRIASRAG